SARAIGVVASVTASSARPEAPRSCASIFSATPSAASLAATPRSTGGGADGSAAAARPLPFAAPSGMPAGWPLSPAAAADAATDAVAVERHQPMVEPHVGLKLGLLAQERREDPETGYVLAQDREADRQRGRQQDAQQAPEPRPEHRRHQQPQGRDPRRLAVDH